MNVVLIHPVYGAKVAINQTEIEQDEKNGWMRYNPTTPVAQTDAASSEVRVKRKYTKRMFSQTPIEQPNEEQEDPDSVSDESEGTE